MGIKIELPAEKQSDLVPIGHFGRLQLYGLRNVEIESTNELLAENYPDLI